MAFGGGPAEALSDDTFRYKPGGWLIISHPPRFISVDCTACPLLVYAVRPAASRLMPAGSRLPTMTSSSTATDISALMPPGAQLR